VGCPGGPGLCLSAKRIVDGRGTKAVVFRVRFDSRWCYTPGKGVKKVLGLIDSGGEVGRLQVFRKRRFFFFFFCFFVVFFFFLGVEKIGGIRIPGVHARCGPTISHFGRFKNGWTTVPKTRSGTPGRAGTARSPRLFGNHLGRKGFEKTGITTGRKDPEARFFFQAPVRRSEVRPNSFGGVWWWWSARFLVE